MRTLVLLITLAVSGQAFANLSISETETFHERIEKMIEASKKYQGLFMNCHGTVSFAKGQTTTPIPISWEKHSYDPLADLIRLQDKCFRVVSKVKGKTLQKAIDELKLKNEDIVRIYYEEAASLHTFIIYDIEKKLAFEKISSGEGYPIQIESFNEIEKRYFSGSEYDPSVDQIELLSGPECVYSQFDHYLNQLNKDSMLAPIRDGLKAWMNNEHSTTFFTKESFEDALEIAREIRNGGTYTSKMDNTEMDITAEVDRLVHEYLNHPSLFNERKAYHQLKIDNFIASKDLFPKDLYDKFLKQIKETIRYRFDRYQDTLILTSFEKPIEITQEQWNQIISDYKTQQNYTANLFDTIPGEGWVDLKSKNGYQFKIYIKVREE